MNRVILLVFAHPDDESFGLAGTVSKYSHQEVPVDLICATRGEKGTRLDVPANTDTGTARELELRTAAAIMGIRHIYLLGYMDGELDKAAPGEIRDRVLTIMRRVKPEVVITFGPDGITGHPDHIAIGKAASEAFDRLVVGGKGPRKLYYVTIPASAASDSDFDVATRPDDQVTTAIDITGYLDKKIKAISAHRSQQDAREFIEFLQQDKESIFARKEFLYLANSGVKSKETDLLQ